MTISQHIAIDLGAESGRVFAGTIRDEMLTLTEIRRFFTKFIRISAHFYWNIYRFYEGSYYFYYCQPDKLYAEGVASSADPKGPFTDETSIDLTGYNQIDPAVFMDDDGQAYYLWGQFSLKMAKLKKQA